MSRIMLVIVLFLSVVSCTKIIESETIADRITISSTLDGKVLQDGDLITIDQVKTKQSWVQVAYAIDGLQPKESVEVYAKYGYEEERLMPVGEGFQVFNQESNTFLYDIDICFFANVFSQDAMKTTLKFKCSDGSEVWKTYPVKLIVDSAAYTPHLILKTSLYQDLPAVVSLNKGEGMYVNVWMDYKIVDQTYLRVISENSFDGVWQSIGSLPGYDYHQKLTTNVREVFIPYEHGLTKRAVQFQLIGKYGSSEIKTLAVMWQ